MLSLPVLIARLINAHWHLLALRISEYLGLDQVHRFLHSSFVVLLYSFFSQICTPFDSRDHSRSISRLLWTDSIGGWLVKHAENGFTFLY